MATGAVAETATAESADAVTSGPAPIATTGGGANSETAAASSSREQEKTWGEEKGQVSEPHPQPLQIQVRGPEARKPRGGRRGG